jgi:hypothetical protein
MWSTEVERTGIKRCSRLAWATLELSYFLGIATLVATALVPGFVAWAALWDRFERERGWLLLLPVGLACAAFLVSRLGWALLRRRGWCYDSAAHVASWNDESGSGSYTAAEWTASWKATGRLPR